MNEWVKKKKRCTEASGRKTYKSATPAKNAVLGDRRQRTQSWQSPQVQLWNSRQGIKTLWDTPPYQKGMDQMTSYFFSAFSKLLNSFNKYILRAYYMLSPVHIKINETSHHMVPPHCPGR